MNKKIRNVVIVASTCLLLLATFGFVRNDFELAKNLDIYASLLRQLDENYVDNINVNEMVTNSIESMLEKLDPYTVYYPESDLEEFKLMTTGQYGGIGAIIQQEGDYVIIADPYEGNPAFESGLRPGDKIIAIGGKNMKGKSVADVSALLKGQPGTKIQVSIEPYGNDKTIEKEIIRKEIKLPSVSYFGMQDKTTGYIRLDQFTEHASSDTKNAFVQLKKEGMEKLVLDLRGNGGGLLSEAVNIVNMFVEKGNLVVNTKGKTSNYNQSFYTQATALDTKIPLVVLIDGTSASASEIVAGSIQDYDRGVIIGERSYGKGLVQNIFPLSYNTRVKVTVSKYYIPSGRCIQDVDYFEKDEKGGTKHKADSSATAHKTKGGRTVYDYGGVEPDIKVEIEPYSTVLLAMLEKQILFNYANEYKMKHQSIEKVDDFVITDLLYQDFLQYVKTKGLSYETFTEKQVKLLDQAIKADKFASLNTNVEDLKTSIAKEKEQDLIRYKKEISELLKMEIAARYYYQKGRIEASLNSDPDLKKALEVLNNEKTYTSILKGTNKN